MTRKAEKAAAKAEKEAAKETAKGRKDVKDTVKRAQKAIGVAKVVVPAVAPAVAPYAVRMAGATREAYDRYRAKRLGVGVDRLAEFTGRGGRLHARIAGVADGLQELRVMHSSGKATQDDLGFTEDAQATLEQLAATVRAAERMPAPRRKAAHKAAADELDSLEAELLKRFGVAGS